MKGSLFALITTTLRIIGIDNDSNSAQGSLHDSSLAFISMDTLHSDINSLTIETSEGFAVLRLETTGSLIIFHQILDYIPYFYFYSALRHETTGFFNNISPDFMILDYIHYL